MATYVDTARVLSSSIMSKPLIHHARSHLTTARRGSLIKHIMRMGLYWLGATLLLWSGSHPLVEWQLATAGWFYVCSTAVVPVMGYASYWLHGVESGVEVGNGRISDSFAITLTQAGLLILELFMVLTTAVIIERLLF
jgi:hypothetical protein